MKTFESNTCNFKVGTNARENWNLLDYALPEDIFVHLNNCPSPYVIIIPKNFTTKITIDDILYGCTICKQFSKKSSYQPNKTSYCYTEVKNVKKGKFLGEAILKNNINIVTI